MLRSDAVVDYQDEGCAVIRHDARDLPLEDGTVDLVVTSPPFWALRSYRDDGEHYEAQIGSEATPAEFLDALDECMVEWGRILKPSGSCFVELGDKYAGSSGVNNWGTLEEHRFKEGSRVSPVRTRRSAALTEPITDDYGAVRTKSLLGLPWRFANRQIDAGWILRAEVIWDKPNGLPESVTDRVRRSHEQWFHFVKEPRYFSGVDEIREPVQTDGLVSSFELRGDSWHDHNDDGGVGQRTDSGRKQTAHPLGRLPGSVWSVPSEPLLIPDDTRSLLDLPDHFAAFPQEWPRRIISGWSPTGICTVCGEGRRPVVDVDWSKVPHEMVEKPVRDVSASASSSFAAEYREWCQANDVTANQLNETTATFMASHWITNATQPAIPSPDYWAMLRAAGYAPEHLDHYIGANEMVPSSGHMGGNVEDGMLTTHRTGVTLNSNEAPPKAITSYACACPTPDAPTTPSLIVDPFGGTGTVAGVAKTLGRYGISNDLSASYNRLAVWRITQSGHFSKTEQRAWQDRQGSLL